MLEKNNRPLVSVVIPCYNHEKFVQDSIQSVIDQSYQNIELIIIDDGSKDHSVEKIQQMTAACESRFSRFEFRTRANKGLSTTLNEALEWCKGEYYSAIASDDMMLEDKTKIQVNFLEENEKCVAVFGGVYLIDELSNIVGERISNTKQYFFEDIILNKHDLPASTQLARLEIIKNLKGYDENIKIEDWYMLLKMTSNETLSVFYLEGLMCKYRFHDNNFSSNSLLMCESMRDILKPYSSHKLYRKALANLYKIEFVYYKRNRNYIGQLKSFFNYAILKIKFLYGL